MAKKPYRIERATFLRASLDEAWNIAATPEGLIELTPKLFGLVLQEPGELRLDASLKLGLKIPGTEKRIDWTAHIVEFEAEGDRRYFVDIQEKGPFMTYRHEHIFEAADDGTWVRDVIEYLPPFWAPQIFTHLSLELLVFGRHESLKKRVSR